jgi:hypothetical protein
MTPSHTSRVTIGTLIVVALCSCGTQAQRRLPRIERYDFLGDTPADLARLRQMAPAETEEGPLARYALARAHAEWLVLALVQDRDDDMLLRHLAVDLGIEGATPDDRVSLAQVLAVIDAVLAEVRAGASAGGEARQWAGATEDLLVAVREGWEEFGPDLVRAVARTSAEDGPARPAADILALGWGRLALLAAQQSPAAGRAELLARMAGYVAPDLVESLHEEDSDLMSWAVRAACPELERQVRDLAPRERLARVRESCDPTSVGAPAEARAAFSAEVVVTAAVLRDLMTRRRRLGEATSDPLLVAAAPDLARFDEALASVRFPLPLPAPGPGLPAPARVSDPGQWRPAGAVITVAGDETRVGLWPTLAVREGSLELVDRVDGLALPGRVAPADLSVALERTWRLAGQRLGLEGRTVAILAPAGVDAARIISVIDAAQTAGAERVDLAVESVDGGQGSLALGVAAGAAAGRSPNDLRALLVVGDEAVQVGTIEGLWTEVQDADGEPALGRIEPMLAEHLAGHGNPVCIVAARPGLPIGRVASLVSLLARAPRTPEADADAVGWTVLLDPDEPPAPAPVASTVSGAVDQHRVRLRGCYERYLRDGGQAQGLLTLEIAVSADGQVREARVVESELGPQVALDSCLVAEAMRMRFPASADTPMIRVPLRFVPR